MEFIEAIGGIPDSLVLSAGGVPGSEKEGEERDKGDGTWGHGYGEDKTKRSTLEEVNLFAGLAGGSSHFLLPTFTSSSSITILSLTEMNFVLPI